MAASPLLSRSRVLSRPFSLALKSESKKPSLLSEIPKPISNSRSHLLQSEKRISLISRLAVGSSGCLLSMLPLHSAIATARLTSVLSAELQSWGLIPQGNAMPL